MTDRQQRNDRSYYEELDASDEHAALRDSFVTVPGEIYLDGNSLGLLPRSTGELVDKAIRDCWGGRGIRAWMDCDWIDLPYELGRALAPIIGACPDEVVFSDSTSVNLYKVVTAALGLNPSRKIIVTETGNFPTDEYVLQGLCAHMGDILLKAVNRDEVEDALTDDVAVLVLTHVHYKSGELFDMAKLTELAQRKGIFVVWDLCHSAGAVPVQLNQCNVDFAIGCGYKYLNGGPGSPAFIYVRKDLQDKSVPAICGWMGHRSPFDFSPKFVPAEGIARFQVGTPPVLGLLAMRVGIALFRGIDINSLAQKSRNLGDLLIERIEASETVLGLSLCSPRNAAIRGCQVSFEHENAFAIVRALIRRGIVGDFRAPRTMRFGFPAMYTRYVDVFDLGEAMTEIIRTRAWDRSEFTRKGAVT